MTLTGSEGISIALIISIASIICTVYTTISSSRKRQKEDVEAEIERRATMKEEFVKVNLKLDTFCRQLEEIIRKYDKTDDRLDDHEKRITKLEKR
jgi:uncharacterized membrane protein